MESGGVRWDCVEWDRLGHDGIAWGMMGSGMAVLGRARSGKIWWDPVGCGIG